MNNVQTLKGFRDFLGSDARKRQYVINILKNVFESYGFEPLETPTLEYDEILSGKYGEEGEKLMYRFEDNGGRKVAMRYDLTVPLSRVVAQYKNNLSFPYKRYQIQNVYRAENTQKGRFREFTQCDIDTAGTSSPLSDAEIVEMALAASKKLGFKTPKVLINDRDTFEGLSIETIITIDKLKKIGKEGVLKELVERNIAKNMDEAALIFESITKKPPTQKLKRIFELMRKLGLSESEFEYSPTLARGLDYYTGLIMEIEIPEYPVGSICGGGRYDKLIGMFSKEPVPAVGCSFGIDRTIEAMEGLSLFPQNLNTTKVLVTIFSPDLLDESINVCAKLAETYINQELYCDEGVKMEKQLKYADQKGIPFVVIVGPEEIEKNVVTLKNMKTREQVQVALVDLPDKLRTPTQT